MPPTPEQSNNADKLDAIITRLLEQGGVKVADQKGNIQLVDFSAAMINAISKRCRDVGATGALPGSGADTMKREFEKRKAAGTLGRIGPPGPIPPLDTEKDDVATA